MAEWLRRWTRNPMGIARAGSNPARSVLFYSGIAVVYRTYLNIRVTFLIDKTLQILSFLLLVF